MPGSVVRCHRPQINDFTQISSDPFNYQLTPYSRVARPAQCFLGNIDAGDRKSPFRQIERIATGSTGEIERSSRAVHTGQGVHHKLTRMSPLTIGAFGVTQIPLFPIEIRQIGSPQGVRSAFV
jgi:hypothetical protein